LVDPHCLKAMLFIPEGWVLQCACSSLEASVQLPISVGPVSVAIAGIGYARARVIQLMSAMNPE